MRRKFVIKVLMRAKMTTKEKNISHMMMKHSSREKLLKCLPKLHVHDDDDDVVV
jgi:hypothetical protein